MLRKPMTMLLILALGLSAASCSGTFRIGMGSTPTPDATTRAEAHAALQAAVAAASTAAARTPTPSIDVEATVKAAVEATVAAREGTAGNPIIMSFVPLGDIQEIIASGDSLARMVSDKTGLVVTANVGTDFAAVREAMCADQAQVGWLNTFNYVLANEKCGVDVALATERLGSTTYRGQIIVRADSGITTLDDLKGKVMCWVDPNSTSGYIIPRIMLAANGIDPDADFAQTVEAGSHNNVVVQVYNGDCDAGATYDDARSSIQEDFPDVEEQVMVLAYTTDTPNDTVAFAEGVPTDIRDQITTALLEIAASDEGKAALNTLYSIENLVPVEDSFYDGFRAELSRAAISIEDLVTFTRKGVWPTTVPEPTPEPTPVSGDLLDQVMAAGRLVVSTDPNYAPQSFISDTGELDGFDVDVAKEVARRLGVELEFVVPDWDLIIRGNWGGRWDVSIGAMRPTEGRAEALWFTDRYYYTPASFAVHEDNTTITKPGDLAGKKVGISTATTYEAYLGGSLSMMGGEIMYGPPAGVQVVPYATDAEAIQDLALGDGVRLDAVLSAQQFIQSAIASGVPLKYAGTPAFYEPLAFALDKSRGPSDQMLAKLNEIIADMHADDTLAELSLKWYGIDLTTVIVPGG